MRPSPIGDIRPHKVEAKYIGFGGDGHWGRLNVSHQFYYAFGKDDFNGIAGKEVDIKATFAAAEFSVDHDWWRIKTAFVWASGDKDPEDDEAGGFDAIFDNPNIGGGAFSFWNREGIRLAQTFVGLKGPSSILNSLRSSKTEGQANFVNPGLLQGNVGWDATLTPKLTLSVNANLLRFQDTSVLSRVLFQESIEKSIGMDYSAGFVWRPKLIDNIIVTGRRVHLHAVGRIQEHFSRPNQLFAPFVVLTLKY